MSVNKSVSVPAGRSRMVSPAGRWCRVPQYSAWPPAPLTVPSCTPALSAASAHHDGARTGVAGGTGARSTALSDVSHLGGVVAVGDGECGTGTGTERHVW